MSVLYCDESGYTGTDLASEAQPFLVISSLLLNDDEVAQLASPLRSATQAEELKYSNLVKRAKSRSALLGFARDLDGMQEQIRFHLTNKRFALLGKIVDLVIEPVFHAEGVDFYAEGRNLAYLNMLYVASLDAVEQRDAVLSAFQDVCRQPTDGKYAGLANAVLEFSAQSEVLRELCKPIYIGIDMRRRHAPDSLGKADLALMASCVISLVRQWNQELKSKVAIVADASNELFRSREVIEMLSDESMPRVAELSAGRILGFPLRITGLDLVDSKARLGVQLADVAAGIINHVQVAIDDPTTRIDGYSEELIQIVTQWARMLQISPEAKFTAEELDRVGFDGSKILDATVEAFKRKTK